MRKVVMIDDLDKSSEASVTLPIFFEGWTYVLDLSDENADGLRDVLKPYLDAAHDKYRGHTPPDQRAKPTPITPTAKRPRRKEPPAKPVRMHGGRQGNYYQLTVDERQELREWVKEHLPDRYRARGVVPNDVIARWLESKGTA